MSKQEISYKGYVIEYGLFGDFYTVQYRGDDVVFNSLDEAKTFVDDVITLNAD